MSLDDIEEGSFASPNEGDTARELIRVVSWNIDRGCHLDDVVSFVADSRADLVCLQEADRNARRSGFRNIAAEIARALRMNYVFGIEYQELSQGSRESPAYHGQATLSTLPLTDARIVRFKAQSRFWKPAWWIPNLMALQRRHGSRIALFSRVHIGRSSLAVYNVHLESRSDQVRRSQLSELIADVVDQRDEKFALVAGDFNLDLRESEVGRAISNMRLRNPFVSEWLPTTVPRLLRRASAIDFMLVKGPLRALDARVHDAARGSDHFPISITLQVDAN